MYSTGSGVSTGCQNCAPGTYSTGLGTPAACQGCPLGTYCPSGTPSPVPCERYYYCPNTTVQLPCPQTFYCDQACTTPLLCPPGAYCKYGLATPCPPHTNSTQGSGEPMDCRCLRGYYCTQTRRLVLRLYNSTPV
jgi:hypothetical protein